MNKLPYQNSMQKYHLRPTLKLERERDRQTKNMRDRQRDTETAGDIEAEIQRQI